MNSVVYSTGSVRELSCSSLDFGFGKSVLTDFRSVQHLVTTDVEEYVSRYQVQRKENTRKSASETKTPN